MKISKWYLDYLKEEKILIHEYLCGSPEIVIKSDLAAEFPVYIYISEEKSKLYYSTSIKKLLDYSAITKPLTVSQEGISFLLQSGVVPLPRTVYENIFIVGIGDTANVKTINNKIELTFSHQFPFFNKDRDHEDDIDVEYILDILGEAVTSRIDKDKPSYLFHSAGKDSNTIALALTKAGYQDKITFISHQSKMGKDESSISQDVATKLGFKHQIIYEPDKIEKKHIDSINHYFENIPLPCMDNIALVYPLYETQIDFNHANIIDGSGNDVYMGHIPNKKEFQRQQVFSKLRRFRPITGKLSSGTLMEAVTMTRTEWAGLLGFTYGDTRQILEHGIDVYPYWAKEDEKRKDWDYLDIRADIWGCNVEFDKVIRKSRNLADISNANLILPFANEKVAHYFSKLPEKYMFDRNQFKNKLILREILKDKIGLDSDKLGKMGYNVNYYFILSMMKKEIHHEIVSSKLWDQKYIEKVLNDIYRKIESKSLMSERLKPLIQRLYLISAWYNKNRYVKR